MDICPKNDKHFGDLDRPFITITFDGADRNFGSYTNIRKGFDINEKDYCCFAVFCIAISFMPRNVNRFIERFIRCCYKLGFFRRKRCVANK